MKKANNLFVNTRMIGYTEEVKKFGEVSDSASVAAQQLSVSLRRSKMSLKKNVAEGQGLFWKGIRGSYRTSHRYVRSGFRAVEFCMLTAVLGTLIYGGYGQATGTGPSMSFVAADTVFVTAGNEGQLVTVTTEGVDVEYSFQNGEWRDTVNFDAVDSENLSNFLGRCAAFANHNDCSEANWANTAVPTLENTNLFPHLVWQASEDLVSAEVPSDSSDF